ncbi:MAG: acetolactate decarboxylase [Candidatus Marinimicrobia bacterium]|nr:acetolactate decarboxylase [Candidatus Neomarinimicrobiota bacterium]
MRKVISIFTAVLFLVSCGESKNKININIYGELFKIMHENQREGTISLPSVISQPHTYGLGSMEGLDGEVLILDSKILVNKVEKGGIPSYQTEVSNDDLALLLVTAQVEKWQTVIIDQAESMSTIDAAVKQYADKMAINTNKPFPFIIEGEVEMVNWHIVSNPAPGGGCEEHSAGSWNRTDNQKKVKIFGFYSEHHQAIFTHHTTFTHMHVLFEDEQLSGHIDDIKLNSNWSLAVPK